MSSPWIYHDERSGKWQVKCRYDSGVEILREFATRGEAYCFAAWGIA